MAEHTTKRCKYLFLHRGGHFITSRGQYTSKSLQHRFPIPNNIKFLKNVSKLEKRICRQDLPYRWIIARFDTSVKFSEQGIDACMDDNQIAKSISCFQSDLSIAIVQRP